jgi:hypothetical protein
MVKNTYACTSCKKTFSRKYNAERHNKLKHDEMAVVYNKETDWISNKRKTNVKAQQIQHTPSSPSSSTISTSDTNNKNTISKPYYDPLEDFNFADQNSKINKNTDIEKVFKIFEKISHLIDDLDTQLSTYKSHEERIKILSEAIIFSLMSSNPVGALKDIINLHRSTMGFQKASGLIAFSRKIPLDQAQLMLKTIILAAPYSKNKFNN